MFSETTMCHTAPTLHLAWLYCSNYHRTSPTLTFAEIWFPIPGHSKALQQNEENLLTTSIQHYAKNRISLTKQNICDQTKYFVNLLPTAREAQNSVQNRRFSTVWVAKFLLRHPSLTLKAAKVIDHKRLEAVNNEHVSEHISRLNALYNK